MERVVIVGLGLLLVSCTSRGADQGPSGDAAAPADAASPADAAVPIPDSSLPPPPAEATASCVYQATPASGISTSTVWLNRVGQVIRVDGWYPDDQDNAVPAPYDFSYDDQGRLVEQRSKVEDIHYIYTADKITKTSTLGGDWVSTLVDGRVTHVEGPENLPVERRWVIDYTYDSAQRYASQVGVGFYDDGHGTTKYGFSSQFTYDAQGRVATAMQTDNGTASSLTFGYAETADQLTISVHELTTPTLQFWTYDFDANHRITHVATPEGGHGYQYLDHEIDETGELSSTDAPLTVRALGTCAPPVVVTAPPAQLPILWSANFLSFSNRSMFDYYNL